MVAWACVGTLGCGRLGFDPVGGVDAAPAGDGGAAVANLAFVTAATFTGAMGGVAGADARCGAAAAAAGLDGRYVALLGDSTRRYDRGAVDARGWVDVTGVVVQPMLWWEGHQVAPLRRDEHGNLVTTPTWLGAEDTGNCNDWSGVGGRGFQHQAATLHYVTLNADLVDCDQEASLLCLQIDHRKNLLPPSPTGRVAFVTATQWLPSGGLAAADAVCTAEAQAAGLPGTFLALLATDSAPAFSRFSLDGPPWRGTHGYQLTDAASGLATPETALEAFLALDATGALAFLPERAWVGDVGATCADWTASSAALSGGVGSPSAGDTTMLLADTATTCDLPARLYCLET